MAFKHTNNYLCIFIGKVDYFDSNIMKKYTLTNGNDEGFFCVCVSMTLDPTVLK